MVFAPKLDASWSPVRIHKGGKRKNLVLVRTSAASIHTKWPKNLKDLDRTWDLLLSHFGEGEPDCLDAEYIVKQGAFKFSAAYQLLTDMPWLKQYSAICFCDDDIMTSWQDLNNLFATFHEFGLDLAQPSLSHNSFWSHQATLNRPQNILRYTNFVEPMLPIFSSKAIELCLSTFATGVTGWGYDWVWPNLLGHPKNKVAVIDAVAVHHTRPVGGGPLYKFAQKVGVDSYDEMAHNLEIANTGNTLWEYGLITAEPKLANVQPSHSPKPHLSKTFIQLLSTALAKPNEAAWDHLPQGWTTLDVWKEGAAKFYQIPELAQDCALSFGFTVTLNAATHTPWIEIIQIGTNRNQARVIVYVEEAGEKRNRIRIRIFDKSGSHFDVITPDLPLGKAASVGVQLIPSMGWVRLWCDDWSTDDALQPIWEWHTTDKLWVGSKRLSATIERVWLAACMSRGPK